MNSFILYHQCGVTSRFTYIMDAYSEKEVNLTPKKLKNQVASLS